jgi:alkylmercury lyase
MSVPTEGVGPPPERAINEPKKGGKTMTNQAPDIDQYWEALDAALPTFTPKERVGAVTLYRELAKGSPVSVEQFAAALGDSPDVARDLLESKSISSLTYLDDEGRVLGFGGLAAAQMPHRLELDGRTLWTWCAWDSLFIPEILGESADVESKDPESGTTIRLTVTPEGIQSRQPQNAVVSFVRADATQFDGSADNVMASFCHFVFFFESRESGERWAANHEGTFLLGLDEAAELARRLNARTWGDALTRTDGRAAVGSRT